MDLPFPSPLHWNQITADGIHTPIAYIYLDENERLSASGFTDYDLAKVAWQRTGSPNNTFWILEQVSPPSWIPFGSGSGSGQDVLVKTTAADNTANYLGAKFLNTDSIVWNVTDPGDNSNQQVYAVINDNSTVQKFEVAKATVLVGTRKRINFEEGANITITATDDPGDDSVNVTIEATGSGTSTDQNVRIDLNDTTSGFLNDKLLVSANGLITSIQNVSANETLTIALPAGSTNNIFRFDGASWVSDGRIMDKGSAAASGNGAVEIISNSSDTSTSTLYVSAPASSSTFAIEANSTIGSAIAGISSQGTGVYAESTTGSGGRGLLVKGKASNDGAVIQVFNNSGNFLVLDGANTVANSLMQFPGTGGIRMWANAASGYVAFVPPTAIASSYSLVLPNAQGSSNTYLKNDGSGNLTWSAGSSTPGGTTGQGQFNNAEVFGGSSGIVMDATSVTTLTVAGITNINNSGSAITNIATSSSAGVTTIGNTGVTIHTNGSLTQTGTFTVVGTTNINSSGTAATLIGNASGGTTTTGPTTQFGALLMKGTGGNSLTINTPPAIAAHSWTLPLAQGAANSFLQNNGSGVLSWSPGTTNNPGGVDTQIQFNIAGVFGGSSNFTWDNSVPRLTVEGELIVNNTAGGRVISFGNNGTNAGGKISIPATGASSILIQTCSSTANAQGFAVVTGNGTGNGNGGTISLLTGTEAGTGHGGGVVVNTGGTVKSGDVNISSGGISTGASGDINIFTGNSSSGNTGSMLITTGEATGTTGNTGGFTFRTGDGGTTTGSAGDITFVTGSAYGTGLQSGNISFTAGDAGNSNATGGGDLFFQAGSGVGSNAGGNITFYPGGIGSGGTYGKTTINGNQNHKLSFWDGAGAAKHAAYTQVYAAVTRVLTQGSAAGVIAALPIGAVYNQAEIIALRDATELVNADKLIIANFVNSMMDDFQSFNLL